MTAVNRALNVTEELQRGNDSLAAADALAERQLWADAISRLYYFLFHSARALLFTRGFEPKSHEGLLRLIGMHFVKTGILAPKDSHVLTQMQKYRAEADYNASSVFTGDDFAEFKRLAVEVDLNIRTYLKEQGYRF
ncbi:MAG: HEPN domain-containing protein [Ignavibacteriae bacterium]|nr:HEPN domain-containing protein [Ignavibacteriota bacterium]